MIIFAQLFLVFSVIVGVIRLIQNEITVKVLRRQVTTLHGELDILSTKNEELIDMVIIKDESIHQFNRRIKTLGGYAP